MFLHFLPILQLLLMSDEFLTGGGFRVSDPASQFQIIASEADESSWKVVLES
jgi:hypothetical protein